ncbi:MAG: response regulator transcription factor [Candidatus Omnitrophica bacterium]|nr:response regulator transcription factor [Candidatus Omnitrophota bacterium]
MASEVKSEADRNKARLFLVDDHPVVREGFAQLINYQTDLEVCGQASTAATALESINVLKPDLVIVDISLRGASGLELIKNIRVCHPELPVLALSMHEESLYAERALRAGAKGYVMKQAPTEDVMKAIRMVLRGQLHLSEKMQSGLLRKFVTGIPGESVPDVEQLSDRELEVFQLVGLGRPTRQIADELHLSVKTVETYRAHIKEKLKLRTGTELIHRAVEWVNREQQRP